MHRVIKYHPLSMTLIPSLCLLLAVSLPAEAKSEDNLALKILSEIGRDEELARSPLRLKVRSVNGDVELSGVVGSARERRLVEEKVRGMEGVRRIENLLRVKTSNRDFIAEKAYP